MSIVAASRRLALSISNGLTAPVGSASTLRSDVLNGVLPRACGGRGERLAEAVGQEVRVARGDVGELLEQGEVDAHRLQRGAGLRRPITVVGSLADEDVPRAEPAEPVAGVELHHLVENPADDRAAHRIAGRLGGKSVLQAIDPHRAEIVDHLAEPETGPVVHDP